MRLYLYYIYLSISFLYTMVLSKYQSYYPPKNRYYGPHGKFSKISQNQSKPTLQPRVVGGASTWYGRAPYQLYYTQAGEYVCGATLVEVYGVQIAITASHCVWEGSPNQTSAMSPHNVEVIGGDLIRKDRDGREVHRKATRILVYETFDPKYFTHDIAIIFLESPFPTSEWIDTALLPGYNWDQPDYVVVSGWGASAFGKELQNYLQLANVPTVEFDTCIQYNQLGVRITENVFCVAVLGGEGFLGTCNGDSGGPGNFIKN